MRHAAGDRALHAGPDTREAAQPLAVAAARRSGRRRRLDRLGEEPLEPRPEGRFRLGELTVSVDTRAGTDQRSPHAAGILADCPVCYQPLHMLYLAL